MQYTNDRTDAASPTLKARPYNRGRKYIACQMFAIESNKREPPANPRFMRDPLVLVTY